QELTTHVRDAAQPELAARHARDRIRHRQDLANIGTIRDEVLRAEAKADTDPFVGRALAFARRNGRAREPLQLEQQLERALGKRGETQVPGPSARRSSTS